MRPFWRILVPVLALCAILIALPSHATPIRPNLKKLLSQPQPKPPEYIPARAGWNGPEQKDITQNFYVQRYSPGASARQVRASLIAAAVPDWRLVIVLALAIFLLRRMRKASPTEVPASHQQPQAEVPRAA